MSKQQVNPFVALDEIQGDYRSYVETFQRFRNPEIRDWIKRQIIEGSILWQEPIIELARSFREGESLEEMVSEGVLESEIPEIFQIEPYYHQSQAVKMLLGEKENVVVATGTGSGKSFCYGIPIVNECLKLNKEGRDGVKALIVYPMNALANSQFEAFTRLLEGTGVTVGKYTGDTPYDPEEAVQRLEGREPLDSEVLSREEIRANPPDILMTNYVMLDLILTRYEDSKLFPEDKRGLLRFFVLDEMHTYTGHRGADVACLVRRVKQRTGTRKELRCVGTSATIESQTERAEADVIAQIASELFGEPFNPSSIIEETYKPRIEGSSSILKVPGKLEIDEKHIRDFDGSFRTVLPLAERLIGRSLRTEERTQQGLGETLLRHPAIVHLKETLRGEPKSLTEIAEEYQREYREDSGIEEVLLEIQAALLAGSAVEHSYSSEEQPILIPKIHAFFSKGDTISSCLCEDGPHLDASGDLLCKLCEEDGKERVSFPLVFCRACGQEFYGVSIQGDGTLQPRAMDTNLEGLDAYLAPVNDETEIWEIPSNWLAGGKIKSAYEDALPERKVYCPECNRIEPDCDHDCKLDVWLIPYPFQLCTACGVSYTKRPSEYNKLFEFSSVGRSTATDVIISSLMERLPRDQQKVISFSDNRQDTALQAAHLNDYQNRAIFRQSLFNAIRDNGGLLRIDDSGRMVYETMERYGVLPDYEVPRGRYITSGTSPSKPEYEKFLQFLVMSDLVRGTPSSPFSLEEAGLLKISYSGLEKLVKETSWEKYSPELGRMDVGSITEYLTGLLDIIRRRGAIHHRTLNDTMRLWSEWGEKFKENTLFETRLNHWEIVGFSDEVTTTKRVRHNSQRVKVMRLTQGRILHKWTEKVLRIKDSDNARNVTEKIINLLAGKDVNYLKKLDIRDRPPVYQVWSDAFVLEVNMDPLVKECPKCGRTFYWEHLNLCTNQRCNELITEDQTDNFYRNLYTSELTGQVYTYAKEHSGQVPGEERQKVENQFKDKDNPLNVIICTPTMELGIDIGDLSAIYMRNVPPDPSHYAQRAGRAGREGQASSIVTYCGAGYSRGPHDQYFYNSPEKIVAGKIVPPRFMLDNENLVERHIQAMILDILRKKGFKLPSDIGDILVLEEESGENIQLFPDFRRSLEDKLAASKDTIGDAIGDAFETEINKFEWFDNKYINDILENFIENFDNAFNPWREEYRELFREWGELNRQIFNSSRNRQLKGLRDAVEAKINNMKIGKDTYYSYRYLANNGFLPNYGFPSALNTLSLYNWKGERRGITEIHRNRMIAIREFAPRNMIYYQGAKYAVYKARTKTEEGRPDTFPVLICEECGHVMMRSKAVEEAACPNCGASFEEVKPNMNCLELPDMAAINRQVISCEEEERGIMGYEITSHYAPNQIKQKKYTLEIPDQAQDKNQDQDQGSVGLSYEHNGRIITINQGMRRKRGTEIRVEGFIYCNACHEWLTKTGLTKHFDTDSTRRCKNKGSPEDIIRDAWIVLQGNHDVVSLQIPCPEDLDESDIPSYYTTLKEAFLQSLFRTFHLDEGEVDGLLAPVPEKENEYRIILYESEEGGIGILNSLLDEDIYQLFIENALEATHIEPDTLEETPDACARACYNCLLRFWNQREHFLMNRNLIIDTLDNMRKARISIEDEGEQDDQFRELLDKCESQLERRILYKIRDEELPLPDKAQKHIYKDDEPIAIADFFYKPKTCIFVDGPPHTQDYVKKADKRKRKRLKHLGYRVLSVKNEEDIETINL